MESGDLASRFRTKLFFKRGYDALIFLYFLLPTFLEKKREK